MKDFAAIFFVCAMTAALIPWPGLFWLWAASMGVVILMTLPESKPRTRVVKRRGDRSH